MVQDLNSHSLWSTFADTVLLFVSNWLEKSLHLACKVRNLCFQISFMCIFIMVQYEYPISMWAQTCMHMLCPNFYYNPENVTIGQNIVKNRLEKSRVFRQNLVWQHCLWLSYVVGWFLFDLYTSDNPKDKGCNIDCAAIKFRVYLHLSTSKNRDFFYKQSQNCSFFNLIILVMAI